MRHNETPGAKWLCVGHQTGACVVWDIPTAKPLKVLADAHDAPIVHMFWVDEKTIVSGDTKGIVLLLTISQVLFAYVLNKQRLLDGDSQVGTVLAMAPLQSTGAQHMANELQLVAMCSAEMAFIVALKPDVSVCFKLKRAPEIRAGAVPYCAWRKATLRDKEGSDRSANTANLRILEPILAVGWGKSIQMMQVPNLSTTTPIALSPLPSRRSPFAP